MKIVDKKMSVKAEAVTVTAIQLIRKYLTVQSAKLGEQKKKMKFAGIVVGNGIDSIS